jgi:hypothetical protein
MCHRPARSTTAVNSLRIRCPIGLYPTPLESRVCAVERSGSPAAEGRRVNPVVRRRSPLDLAQVTEAVGNHGGIIRSRGPRAAAPTVGTSRRALSRSSS